MTRFFSLSTLALLSLTLGGAIDASGAETWSQWRGPQRDGRIPTTSWPTGLSEASLKAGWSIPLGPSYSGPIVSSKYVFVTETKNKTYEVVRALDRKTGSQVWETQWKGSLTVPFFAASNGSWIRATPAFDGERLYVAGIRDVLVCLDAATGDILWKVDFVAKTGSSVPSFGFVSSPLVLDDHVYVQAGASFVKLDKLSGEIAWSTLKEAGGMQGSAFSSPVAATIAGVRQLVVQTRTTLAGVRPDNGKVLWAQKVPAFRGMNILTPTVIGDSVFTSSYGGGSLLYKISRDGDDWKVEQVWKDKAQAYMSSPVVIDGYIYTHLRNQRFTCLDIKTGKTVWTSKPFGKYWSLVANGNKLLALDQRGELLLIEASPEEFKLVARRQVADDSWAHLAVVGGEIYIRDLRAMKRFDWK